MPDCGQIVSFFKNQLLGNLELVKHLVTRNDQIRISMPSIFITLCRHEIFKVQEVFKPAFSLVTWCSCNIPQFCEEAGNVVDTASRFVKKVTILNIV